MKVFTSYLQMFYNSIKTGQTVFIVRNYADPNNIQQLSNQPAHVLPVSNLSAEGTNRIQLKMEPGQQNEGIVLGRPSGLTFLVSNPTNMSFLNDVENPSDLKNLPEESLALVSSTSNASQNSAVINQFCPVCGDHISGMNLLWSFFPTGLKNLSCFKIFEFLRFSLRDLLL